MDRTQNSVVGQRIRSFRAARGMGQAQAARLAGVNHATLYRWETGTVLPRWAELDRFLASIGAGDAERGELLAMLDTPEARRELAALVSARARQPDYEGIAFGQGPVWRSLRLSRHLTIPEVARRLGVTASTVSRWETGRTRIPGRRLVDLADLFEAPPELRASLQLWRTTGSPASPVPSLDECASNLETIRAVMPSLVGRFEDARFLQMEDALARHAASSASALPLLAEAWVLHAEYLLWGGRRREMRRLAALALSLQDAALPASRTTLKAAGLYANALAHSAGGAGWTRGSRVLSDYIAAAEDARCSSAVLRDQAEYEGHAGRFEAALSLARRSRRAALAEGCEASARLSDTIEARILILGGRPADALRFLCDDAAEPGQRFFQLANWASALAALGDRSGASERLGTAVSLARANGLDHLLVHAERIGSRL